jgi:hypothetical protein
MIRAMSIDTTATNNLNLDVLCSPRVPLTGETHYYHSGTVALVFGVVVFGFQAETGEDGRHQVGDEGDHAETGGCLDVRCNIYRL